jgi:hypothetical protein
MKKKTAHKRPAVNKVYYIYVGILAVLFFVFVYVINHLHIRILDVGDVILIT